MIKSRFSTNFTVDNRIYNDLMQNKFNFLEDMRYPYWQTDIALTEKQFIKRTRSK